MKRIFLFAAICAAVVTSCEKKEKTPELAGNQVSFVIDGPMTRVSTVGNASIFETGDKVSITSKGLYEDITNETYTVGDDKLTGKTVYFGKGEAAFVAHYPADLANTDGSIAMTVGKDQDSDEDFHKNMFMVGTATGSKDNTTVSLSFAHKLSMVKVIITGLDKASSVTLSNILPTVTWTAEGLTTDENEEVIDIAAWKQDNKQEYWALVPAQEIAKDTKFILITDSEGKEYEYVLAKNISFTAGKAKTISLTFKGNLAEAEFSKIDDVTWSDDDTPIEDVFDVVPPTPVEAVTLDKTEAEMNIGATLTLTATVTPDNATDKAVVWTSSDETVATVADGVVTAIAAGETEITATAGEKSATCTVTVSEKVETVPATSVTLDKETATVKVGKSLTLAATVAPDNATDKKVVWSSSEPTVATVADGVVTAIAAGTTDITATVGELSATCTVTVEGLLELISAAAGDFSQIDELNPTVTGWASAKTPGWALIKNGEGSVVFDTDLGEVQLVRSNSDWYKIGLVYYTGANVKAGTYTLAVSLRNIDATEDETSDDIQLRVYDTAGNAQIGSTQTIATKKDVTIAKRDITLSQDYANGISFVFYPKSNDGFTYAIQNVTVIEKQ